LKGSTGVKGEGGEGKSEEGRKKEKQQRTYLPYTCTTTVSQLKTGGGLGVIKTAPYEKNKKKRSVTRGQTGKKGKAPSFIKRPRPSTELNRFKSLHLIGYY